MTLAGASQIDILYSSTAGVVDNIIGQLSLALAVGSLVMISCQPLSVHLVDVLVCTELRINWWLLWWPLLQTRVPRPHAQTQGL